MTTIKVNVVRRPTIKVKALVKFPANIHTQNFLTVTNSGGTYTFSVDYSVLTPGPIIDPTTAYVAVQDQTSGIYRTVTLSSLLTSGLDADLQAIAALTGTGILARTASNTWVLRAVTGTANEITVTNGDGVAGNPTLSLPSALTFTGKTVTGGTFNGGAANALTTLGIRSTGTGAFDLQLKNSENLTANHSLDISLNNIDRAINISGNLSFASSFTTSGAFTVTQTYTGITTVTFPTTGTLMTLGNTETVTGVKTFGSAGAVGRLKVAGTTSGSTVLDATAIASGTLTLPAATDTLVGKATTDILTNKTYDTAGAGNSFSINSLAATANTGTGAVVRATSPTLVTPALGTPTALVLTSATGLPLSGLTTQAAFTFVGNNTGGAAIPTAVDIATLTSKASPAASDLVMISDQAATGAWKKVTVSSLASAGSVASLNGQTGALAIVVHPQGRLTLQTATPVMTTTQSAKTTIFYSAYIGNQVPIYDGTNMVPTAITGGEISVATTDTTKSPAAIGASKVNDWFIWNDAGTIRIGHGPDWTSDTARSAGTALVMVNGILLNNAALTNGPAASRGTYVGTTRSNGSSQLDWIFGAVAASGTAGFLGVWNAYNRVNVMSMTGDSTTSWTYASTTWRQADNSANIRTSYVCGLAEDYFTSDYMIQALGNASTDVACIGIGYDVTNALSGFGTYSQGSATASTNVGLMAKFCTTSLGFHFMSAIERASSAVTVTYLGLNATTAIQSGITFLGRM